MYVLVGDIYRSFLPRNPISPHGSGPKPLKLKLIGVQARRGANPHQNVTVVTSPFAASVNNPFRHAHVANCDNTCNRKHH
jgi:hypothetical protein